MSVFLTAVTPGAGGNSISMVFTPDNQPAAPNLPLTVTVVGLEIQVQGATDGAGLITSTELAVANAINAAPAAAALVVATGGAAVMLGGGGQQFLNNGSGGTGGGYAGLDPGNFKILLLDTNGIATSNIPLLWSNLIHVPQTAPTLTTTSHSTSVPENFWPTPPMLYRVNTSLRFLIYVTSATPLGAGSTWDFNFSGVRRYQCGGGFGKKN